MATPRDLIAAARIRVVNRCPYLGSIALSLKPVETKGVDTLAVDRGWRLYYDPEYVTKLNIDELSGVIFHEINHCLRDHFTRRGNRDPQLSNVCEDAEINDDVKAAGFKLPGNCVYPATIHCKEGEPFEVYYDQCVKHSKKICAQLPDDGKGQVGAGKCGGCAGNPHDWEPKEGQGQGGEGDSQGSEKIKGGPLDGKEIPKATPQAEQAVLRRQTANAIREEAKKSRGNVPRGLVEWADKELEPPKIDWQKRLAALVRRAIADKAGAVDFSFKRPARRQAALNLMLGRGRAPIIPTMRAPIPNVAVCLDVSGSMMGGPAAAARSEVLGIVKATGCPLDVYQVDVRVANKKKVVGKGDVVKLGETLGGTSMRAGAIEIDQKARHDVLVVLTDGYTDWPARHEVKSTVLACITPGGDHKSVPAHIPVVLIDKADAGKE